MDRAGARERGGTGGPTAMYFSELGKHLKTGRLKPVYVVFGNNALEVNDSVAALRARAGRDGDAALSVIEFPRDQRDLAQVMDALGTVPMFVAYTMVVLQDAGEFVNRHRKALEAYIEKPSPTGVLVLTVSRWQKTTRVAKLVEKLGASIACWLPRSSDQVLSWVQRRARTAHGKGLSAGAAQLLADLCQEDPAAMSAELKKLDLYVGGAASITEEDVSAAAMSYGAYRPFDLCDRLAAGDRRGAFGVVEGLMAEGIPAVVLIGTLRSYFRRLLEAKLMAEDSGVGAAVAKFAGHPKERDGFRRQLAGFSADALVGAHRRLLEADLAAKTSRYPEHLIVERLLLALSAGPQTASAG